MAIHQPIELINGSIALQLSTTVGVEKARRFRQRAFRWVAHLLHGNDIASTAIHTYAHIVSAAINTLNDESRPRAPYVVNVAKTFASGDTHRFPLTDV
jgi:hypothetical protein